jgi:poly(A) polymerase
VNAPQTFPREPWMTAPAALFAALGAPAVDVRFVGGCVRNWLMKRPITDFDLATPEPPDVVMQRLEKAGLRAIPTGIAHGTVTAVLGDETYEITSLRRDTACDGRHAAVEFTTDWAEDARRRDFTINAMSLRPDGALFDYHDGLEDAKAGRVRFVGDPADRIQEDYLRILRLCRFFAW